MVRDGGETTRLMRREDYGGEGVRAGRDAVRSGALPDRLIRTVEGYITAWSPGMQRRYGFTSEEAHGRTSHQLLRTIFPRALQAIESTLHQRNSWTGGLIHRHADGRAVMAANHWYVFHDINRQACLVTEVHSDIAPDGSDVCHQLADVLAALACELTEPLTACNNYVAGAQLILQQGSPDLQGVRVAMAQASGQIARGAEGVNLLRRLANDMHDTS